MKVLVTYFPPFGIKRILGKPNESKVTAWSLFVEGGIDTFSLLPLSLDKDKLVGELTSAMQVIRPNIILLLGEDQSVNRITRIEPYANLPNGKKIHSKFVKELKKEINNPFIGEGIGNWCCNEAYKTALIFNKNTQNLVCFVHTGGFFSREQNIKVCQDLLNCMIAKTKTQLLKEYFKESIKRNI